MLACGRKQSQCEEKSQSTRGTGKGQAGKEQASLSMVFSVAVSMLCYMKTVAPSNLPKKREAQKREVMAQVAKQWPNQVLATRVC